mmetsp:Transcript_13326/g.21832  ORF Transcript_13326/g.21832 Transcript_13326/m.21832 type:complete len:109 (+) Transcript_13326:60-386(+)|eukprot:CAMPEP_0114434868 /NCGR_PEP_ID=MMETSP0103-20121206/12502_1 /TAXON_ID=37642 ORGANISM="Paraphysomonas imperforata, Strain PA2" /NCGR_SAMPLE_ID=MMETSP0103 /ASSEMBLY_ACC=CAM_ASM_000201 /LENGTH=108 /DNA_ID=CAMNT_0001604807 /DNA_START=29 /DNA_END=355 /DNA_ORIENTATION=-
MSKNQNVVDMEKYLDQRIRVKFQGGREVSGLLKGFDKLDNLVLDDCIEYLRDPNDAYRITDNTRNIGLVVCRGTQVSFLSPVEGIEEIANPFTEEELGEEEEEIRVEA